MTVTVNMTDPEVGERIYPWILWNGRKVRGAEASRILSERQMEGIALLRARGVLVKVNSVVIPGVNEGHLPDVARAVRGAGAFLVNLVPLLSAPEHGTHFGLSGPARTRRRRARGGAARLRGGREAHAPLPPVPGRRGGAARRGPVRVLHHGASSAGPARDAGELRAERRAAIERVQAAAARERDAVLLRLAGKGGLRPARVAVATKSGGLVDQHFGHAKEFLVYDVAHDGVRLVGRRSTETYCAGGDGDDDALQGAVRALSDCQAVLVARIGRCPGGQLAAAGIEASQAHAHRPIEAALLEWLEARPGGQEPRAEVA